MALICIGFAFCKKSTDGKPKCRIIKATEEYNGGSLITNIKYYLDGKISEVSNNAAPGIHKKFTYSGNNIRIITSTGGAFLLRDSITLNSNGNISNMRRFDTETGDHWANYSMEYSGDLLVKYSITYNFSPSTYTFIITQTAGNVTKVVAPAGPVNYEYYTDKDVQPGDYLRFQYETSYGVNFFPQKNLVSVTDFGGPDIYYYTYEFNENGLISTILYEYGIYDGKVTYEYECK